LTRPVAKRPILSNLTPKCALGAVTALARLAVSVRIAEKAPSAQLRNAKEFEEMIERSNAEHYVWGGNCDGWHLVKASGLSVIEESMPPGGSEVRHHHKFARQFICVLEGRLSFELSDKRIDVHPGQGLEIAPGVSHRAFNESASVASFLVISSPPTGADRVLD
jgi:mannose-6-phosphate isomerase-like protein (cupin superfamily)